MCMKWARSFLSFYLNGSFVFRSCVHVRDFPITCLFTVPIARAFAIFLMVNIAALSRFFCRASYFEAFLSYILLSSPLILVLWNPERFIPDQDPASNLNGNEPFYPQHDLCYWAMLSSAGSLILSHFIHCRNPDLEPILLAGTLILSPFHLQDPWLWANLSAEILKLRHFICGIPDIEPFFRQDVWYWAILSAGCLILSHPFHLQDPWYWAILSAGCLILSHLSGGCLILSHFSGRMSDIEPFHLQDPFLWLLT